MTEHGVSTETVWQEFRDRLFLYIRGQVRTERDAEDILQLVFTRVHSHAERLDGLESVSAWVFSIAKNAVTDHYRAEAAASRALDRFARHEEGAVSEPGAGEEEPNSALAKCLSPLVRRLPPHYAEALELAELEGLSQSEAAQRAGLSLSGMKSRVTRGRVKLKELLLQCCTVELDRRRRVVDFRAKSGCRCDECD